TRTMHTHQLAGSRDRPAGPDQIADEPEPDCLYCGGFIQSGLVAPTSGSVGSVAGRPLDTASTSAGPLPKISSPPSHLASLAFNASFSAWSCVSCFFSAALSLLSLGLPFNRSDREVRQPFSLSTNH